MYNCEILADSLNPQGDRLITMKITYPRIVHSELMAHREFSRNAASSRAIPIKRMIESIRNNMFTPLAIQKAHKGMQGSEYFEGMELEQAKQLWIESAELALQQAEKMERFGITKQIVNRVIEPYQYYQVLVTANESAFNHFFELRCPLYKFAGNVFKSKKESQEMYSGGYVSYPSGEMDYLPTTELGWLEINKSQADIHIQAISELMYDSVKESKPKELKAGEWHFPYHKEEDVKYLVKLAHSELTKHNKELFPSADDLQPIVDKLALKVICARCARISYETLGERPRVDHEADIRLHDMLLESGHMSPFEHCARAMSDYEYENYYISISDESTQEGGQDIDYGRCRNFKGFIQYRNLVENKLS